MAHDNQVLPLIGIEPADSKSPPRIELSGVELFTSNALDPLLRVGRPTGVIWGENRSHLQRGRARNSLVSSNSRQLTDSASYSIQDHCCILVDYRFCKHQK